MPSLLLVEDDAAIAEPLAQALRREGYEVEAVEDGITAAQRGVEGEHDLVVLDLGLPGLDGVEVCRRIRAARPGVPVLMLTARAEEVDTIVGLDAGADDYVSKPMRVGELLARVRALLRRAPDAPAADVVEVNGVRVDRGSRRVWVDDGEVELTPKEFDLLSLLVGEAGRVVTRDHIMSAVWDENWYGSTKTLDMHVSWLRRKLGDDATQPRRLVTVRGVGFRFERG